jgi:hypothetical protein
MISLPNMNWTKLAIIGLGLVLVYLLFFSEKFDIQAPFNLLTSDASIKDIRVPIPIIPIPVDDNEVPNRVEFDKRVDITDLQKLKAINNILERIKEVNSYRQFNPALRQVTTFTPDSSKLSYINQYIIDKLSYYSGGQYKFVVDTTDGASGSQTEDQYMLSYNLNGSIDSLSLSIKIIVIISKPDINNSDMDISFNEIRVNNPEVFITPNTPFNNNASILY